VAPVAIGTTKHNEAVLESRKTHAVSQVVGLPAKTIRASLSPWSSVSERTRSRGAALWVGSQMCRRSRLRPSRLPLRGSIRIGTCH